jgi:rhodanese-related sulfurtransferase
MKTIIRVAILATILFSFSCFAVAQESKQTNPASKPKPASYDLLKAALDAPGENLLLLDVRTKEEFEQGHIPGAALMPYDSIQTDFKEADKSRPIVVYCRSGNRSSIAARILADMGYTDVTDFGAVSKWRGRLQNQEH